MGISKKLSSLKFMRKAEEDKKRKIITEKNLIEKSSFIFDGSDKSDFSPIIFDEYSEEILF